MKNINHNIANNQIKIAPHQTAYIEQGRKNLMKKLLIIAIACTSPMLAHADYSFQWSAENGRPSHTEIRHDYNPYDQQNDITHENSLRVLQSQVTQMKEQGVFQSSVDMLSNEYVAKHHDELIQRASEMVNNDSSNYPHPIVIDGNGGHEHTGAFRDGYGSGKVFVVADAGNLLPDGFTFMMHHEQTIIDLKNGVYGQIDTQNFDRIANETTVQKMAKDGFSPTEIQRGSMDYATMYTRNACKMYSEKYVDNKWSLGDENACVNILKR
jgi:hypothetical protein